MRTVEQLYSDCGKMLETIRIETGSTKERMAMAFDTDRNTYNKYESGLSAPRVPEFIAAFDDLGKDAMRTVLDYIYPDVYNGLTAESDIVSIRNAAIHYFTCVATERELRTWSYIAFGSHGGNIAPILEEYLALEHLPLGQRVIVGDIIKSMYRTSEALGDLVGTDHIMPDKSRFDAALESARSAISSGRDRYTTILSGSEVQS